MSNLRTLHAQKAAHLSITFKRPSATERPVDLLQISLIQTDLHFNITGWNTVAASLQKIPMQTGIPLTDYFYIDVQDGTLKDFYNDFIDKGFWSGEVRFKFSPDNIIHFATTASYVRDELGIPVSIIIVSHNITGLQDQLTQKEIANNNSREFLDALAYGVVVMDAGGKITASNLAAKKILPLTSAELAGKVPAFTTWNALTEKGGPFPLQEMPSLVCLATGKPRRNVVMGFPCKTSVAWFSVNAEPLKNASDKKPFAVVVSFTEISNYLLTEHALRESNDRFFQVAKLTSDAVWDIDLETNKIFRSDTFSVLSGYKQEEIYSSLDWWFTKVHEDDRHRVRNKVYEYIDRGLERWEDEYRFECADGSYKYLIDSGLIIYKNGVAKRIVGVIRDVSMQKKLEKQLLLEQAERHKAIARASIKGQEAVKASISQELHDNVNQILMSAKLFMDNAKRIPHKSDELIDKAIEYQLMALEEIRKLSKTLSSSHIQNVGLCNGIHEIVESLSMIPNMEVDFSFAPQVEENLNDEQKLHVFRIIQEQTNNILKYANATEILIDLTLNAGKFILLITDNGIGFDAEKLASNGIGLINMASRAEACGGQLDIRSEPGFGCTLEVILPI